MSRVDPRRSRRNGERPLDSTSQAPARPAQIARSESPSADQRSSDYGVLRLTTLLGVARMLTSELDLAEIVRQVLVRAIEVIPAADAGTLFSSRPESGRLVVSDSVGFGPSIFNLSLEPGEAAAGRAFIAERGEIYANPEAVQDALANAKPEDLPRISESEHKAPQSRNGRPTDIQGDASWRARRRRSAGRGDFYPDRS